LLGGSDPTLRDARAIVEAGRPLPGAVDSASAGAAMLIGRVASDLVRDNASPASLTLARIASFAAPDNDAIKLTLAQTLANNGRASEALTVLDSVGPPFASAVREIRIATLQRLDRLTDAVAEAQAAITLPDASLFDYARLGDAHGRLKQYVDAANAYHEAIKRAGDDPPWNLWLLYGGALDQAGDWTKAKPALERAVASGPDQPAALNHLGYAMLEHGEDLIEATRLIAKASSLRPDDAAITDSLGWAFYLRGQPEQSIPLLERAVASDPTEAALGEHLGDAYWAAGRRVDARYAWRAALVQAEEEDVTRRIERKIADGPRPPAK
jgi:tetratricopeptide (TPR) repeat protein